MPGGDITTGRIILVIIVVAGFVTAIVLLRNTLNKNCSQGEIYDETLGRCIKDCSTFRNQHYSSEKDACVTNCLDNEIVCGDGCASDSRNEDCLTAEDGSMYICRKGQTLCGGACMDRGMVCINGKMYKDTDVCDPNPDKPVICDTDTQQCDRIGKTCISCKKGNQLCGSVCCADGNFCGSDGKCTPCDPKSTTVCGTHCCQTGNELCSSDKSRCIPCQTSLCKDQCLEVGQVCTEDGPCDPSHVYTQGDKQYCCHREEGACGATCCGEKQACHGGKCMDVCGNDFCDPYLQSCYTEKSTGKQMCINKGCEWDTLVYDPQSLETKRTKGQYVDVCGMNDNGTIKYYATKHQGAFRHARDEQSSQSQTKVACTSNDCIARMAEYGLNTVEFDDKAKTCNALFDCNTLLPDTLKECPFQNTASCCTDASGAFTGQVCPEGQNCLNGVCAPSGYYCHTDGQCVEVKNPSSLDGFYKSKDDCSAACIPQTITRENVMTQGPAPKDIEGCPTIYNGDSYCQSLAQYRGSNGHTGQLDANRDWTCAYVSEAPKGDGFGECPVYCKCSGKTNLPIVYH